MRDILAELKQRADGLLARIEAANTLLRGDTTQYRKRADLVAKLPETLLKQEALVNKWQGIYNHAPIEYNREKLARAQARLRGTQRQVAKLAASPIANELAEMKAERTSLLAAIAVIEQHNEQSQSSLLEVLTERYVIDSISGDIIVRATGAPVTAAMLTVNGIRHPIKVVRELMLSGELA